MSSVALSGNDTIKINQRILSDLASGDIGTLNFPNELMAVKTGKNGNTIYSFNETGRQAELVLRLIRGSSDDKYLNSLLLNMKLDATTFTLMSGEVVKRVGDGSGVVISDTYVLTGGVFSKEVETKINTEGDVEQSVAVYTLRFAKAPRALT